MGWMFVTCNVTHTCSFLRHSQHYNCKAFSEQEVFEPHLGEIVAARYSDDVQWYRARVVDVSESFVQVSGV